MTGRLWIVGLLMVTGMVSRENGAITAVGQGNSPSFSEAELFFELNDTDGDLGLHGAIDGGPWTSLEITAPNDRVLLNILATNALYRQGLTQLFFESAEPPFDALEPAVFFKRFPEGRYQIEGLLQGGGEIDSVAVLSHVLPAPPGNVQVAGQAAAENCDAVPLPMVNPPVIISWDPVTSSHPEIGKSGPVKIARYQFFVEQAPLKLSLDLLPAITQFEVPAALTAGGGQFKFEIIARSTTGNNTAIESCFVVQ